jgi:hypothetical protein
MARKITRRKTPLDLQPLTQETLRTIHEDIDEHLEIIGKERGITFTLGGFNYDPYYGNFTVKLDGVMKGGQSREETIYENNAPILKLPKIRTVFDYKGSKYKIIGYKVRGTKQPILTEQIGTGKKYTFAIHTVKEAVK